MTGVSEMIFGVNVVVRLGEHFEWVLGRGPCAYTDSSCKISGLNCVLQQYEQLKFRILVSYPGTQH